MFDLLFFTISLMRFEVNNDPWLVTISMGTPILKKMSLSRKLITDSSVSHDKDFSSSHFVT